MASKEAILSAAKQFLSFINKAPSPYHAVSELKTKLLEAGFKELREADHWAVKPLDKCFVTRNESTLIAFAVGGKFKPGNGFSIIGAHTDSPCLKVKPNSKKTKCGYQQVGVECYGGGTWHTWFDRDLKLAGRVLLKSKDGRIDHKLLHIERPILRIPNIAIHLQRDMNDHFSPNKENHLCPVLATEVRAQLDIPKVDKENADKSKNGNGEEEKHHSVLTKLICSELDIEADQIMDFELCLADSQPAAIGGALEEFLFCPRLDNLMSSYGACLGLIGSCSGNGLDDETNIRMISLFDNEEVGSQTAQGARSTLQELLLRRLSSGGSNQTAFEEAIPKSYMLSADMAHAIHPNYSEKHEANHQPALHKGIVIKRNANQSYATTAITTSILRVIAEKASVPLQEFVVRNDSACGSTIGPIMSAKLGIPTIDIGAPQLSMHSIREMGCTTSVLQYQDLFTTFFQEFPTVYASLRF